MTAHAESHSDTALHLAAAYGQQKARVGRCRSERTGHHTIHGSMTEIQMGEIVGGLLIAASPVAAAEVPSHQEAWNKLLRRQEVLSGRWPLLLICWRSMRRLLPEPPPYTCNCLLSQCRIPPWKTHCMECRAERYMMTHQAHQPYVSLRIPLIAHILQVYMLKS